MSQFRTPLKNARGLGSAKSGTMPFIHQRLTATALVVLTLWFLCLVLSLIGADYVTAVETVAKPWNAIALVGFLVAMLLFCGVRQRVENANPPESFKGLPITLVSASITSLSFMGFGGLVENIINALM